MRISALIFILIWPAALFAQGFAGLGSTADEGFAVPERGAALRFPEDHGAHPDYRIEWWYLTANLVAEDGREYGIQWTLFRSALAPYERDGWQSPQIWFAHAGLSTPERHFSAERQARGGIGQAGVTAAPFTAWIDDWSLEGDFTGAMQVRALGAGFGYDLSLNAEGPLVRHGDEGYSVKSEAGQASYYYSQPFFRVGGELVIADERVAVTGQGWLDREWSSQPLAEDQSGWDWLSLHLDSGAKLMGFRLRHDDGRGFVSGSYITPDGNLTALTGEQLSLTPIETQPTSRGEVPTTWRISLADPPLRLEARALHAESWMAVIPPYWEGPVAVTGSETGIGYLEMTGYD